MFRDALVIHVEQAVSAVRLPFAGTTDSQRDQAGQLLTPDRLGQAAVRAVAGADCEAGAANPRVDAHCR
jgi:hypothetical protein